MNPKQEKLERTPISELKDLLKKQEENSEKSKQKKILIKGWVHEVRDLSKIKFILLRDHSGIVQTVTFKDSEAFDTIAKIPKESVTEIIGFLQESKVTNEEVTEKTIEIVVESYKILSESKTPLPLQVVQGKDEAEFNTRLDWRCIDLRKLKNQAIFQIESKIIEAFSEYLYKSGFQQVFTPAIIGAPSESGSEMFEIKYFDKKAYLRQDPQLHRQLTIASGVNRLFEIGPNWRAERSNTTKHLCEHRACAVELAFLEDEYDTMKIQEELIVYALEKIKKECTKELRQLNIDIKIPKIHFPELRFPEIYDILEKNYNKHIRGEDLDSDAQKMMWDYVMKKYNSEFYFFNRFPSKIKPFYVMRVDEDPEYARSVDLNWKGLELSSGGQREHRYEKIIQQVDESGMSRKSVEWFTRFFKYGVPPHGGFAIGIERFTQALLNLQNIRETVLFPRDPKRINP